MENIIEVKNLTKRYGVFAAVDNISFVIIVVFLPIGSYLFSKVQI